MSDRVRVVCLPIANLDNPYQHLMMRGLAADDRIDVRHGSGGRQFALLRSVLRFRPDFLHLDWIHSYYLHHNPVVQTFATIRFLVEVTLIRLTTTRIVWTVHNIYPHRTGKQHWQRWLRRYFASCCERIRVFDTITAERVCREFDSPSAKVFVIPEGSYRGYYEQTTTTESARASFGYGPEDFVFGYIGYIDAYKGVTDLLEAFATLPAKENRRLLLAGTAKSADFLASVRRQVSSSPVIRLDEGFVDARELQRYFAAMDVVCLPFREISNSGSTILAMGFGKPIIAPRKGAVAQRLHRQPELLYDEPAELRGKMATAIRLGHHELARIGERNLTALGKHQWSDFQQFFLPIQKLS